jgi:hypothetical protein
VARLRVALAERDARLAELAARAEAGAREAAGRGALQVVPCGDIAFCRSS